VILPSASVYLINMFASCDFQNLALKIRRSRHLKSVETKKRRVGNTNGRCHPARLAVLRIFIIDLNLGLSGFCVYNFCCSIWLKANQRLTAFMNNLYNARLLVYAAD